MNKKILRSIAGGFLFVIFVMAHQNCGEINLQKIEEASVVAATKVEGEFCSLASVDESVAITLIFAVDMSGSNIRKPVTGVGFTRDGATDLEGNRFAMIQNFISSGCLKGRTNLRFGIYGFSTDVMPLTAATCKKSRLVDAAAAGQQVQELVQIQETEPLAIPTNMRATVYESALSCAGQIIQDDQAGLPADSKRGNVYHVMFLSDGQPTNSSAVDLVDYSTIFSAMSSVKTAASTSGGVVVQPVLYGADYLRLESQTKYDSALGVMREIARRGDSVETSVSDAAQINFCELFNSGRRTPFVVTSFGVVNLTALMKNGRLRADSDMDGIPDEEERERGFNPSKARSGVAGSQALDGLCRLNANQCPARQCGPPNELGLTDCEIGDLGLTDGLDSDKDGIPDFVEILKGTIANESDAHEDVDGDGDIMSKELFQGRDPNFFDRSADPLSLLQVKKVRSNEETSACPAQQERWLFEIENLPLVPTVATQASDAISKKIEHYVHKEGENVIFVYYIIRASSQADLNQAELYGQFFKVSSGREIYFKNFKRIGKLNGLFKEKVN